MKQIKILLLALLVSGISVGQQAPPTSITLSSAAPAGVRGISVSVTGNTGSVTYFYWVIANFPIGKADANSNAQISNAPNVLSGTNFVTVSWNPVAGATSYDVIRSTGNAFPGSCNSCAIVIGTAGPTFNDIGGVGLFYTYTAATGATASITLDNSGYTIPRLLQNKPVNTTLFANLPPASQHNQEMWVVIDAMNFGCTAGGSSGTPAVCISNGTSWIATTMPGGGGTGNVTGPASSTTGDLASFSNTTGTLIQDSGVAATNVDTLNGNTTLTGNKTFTGTVNAAGAAHTSPMKTGLTSGAPATCTVGEMYFATDGPAGANELYCTATNVFSSEKIVTSPTNRVANQFMTSLSGANPSVFGFSAIVAADLPAALTSTTSVNGTAIPASSTITQSIGTGTIVVPVTSLAGNSCDAAATTVAIPGTTVGTDTWSASPTTDPTVATGYGGGTNGGITLWVYLTANTANLKRCNQTANAIVPGALSLLVKVIR